MNQAILSLLVHNNFGVLTKVTGLFSRRGFNIKSMSVGETDDPRYSRITLVTEGDEAKLQQISRQVQKLEDVRAAALLPQDNIVPRELVLIKVRPEGPAAVDDLKQRFGVKTLEAPDGCVVLELSAPSSRVDELVAEARRLGIVEMTRTGATALVLSGDPLRVPPEGD